MKIFRPIGCILLLLFLLFTPRALYENAQRTYVDPRFVRTEQAAHRTVVLYHIVRHRPYLGSLTAWLSTQAQAFERQHRGVYLTVEGMDEATFCERLEYGRRADAYSFFSGSLHKDLLKPLNTCDVPLRSGLFTTDCCVPYGFTGYGILRKNPAEGDGLRYYANDLLAARLGAGLDEASEQKAQTLVLDFRRGGDLIRNAEGFALAAWEPIDSFTDAVCWLGIDRDADDDTAAILSAFFDWLLSEKCQQSLCGLGMLPVRADVNPTPPNAELKALFRAYQTVVTVDPFRWYAEYETLQNDAALARAGDEQAQRRFSERLQELLK